MLQEFVSDVNADQQGDGGIQVYIGDETPIQSMKDCSVVTANYDLGGGLRGTVGIIGPKRMDYEKVLGTLKNLMTSWMQHLKRMKGDSSERRNEK